ncbi:MCM2/3/5 family-domain-containing protein [Gaertneriomyces semiglobifer]|nr:MCM2/3/5 family-domain-containing protein [Gaertneriomyces semiglobifer]
MADSQDIIQEIASILLDHWSPSILNLLTLPHPENHYPFVVSLPSIATYNSQLAFWTYDQPTRLIPLYDMALSHAQRHVLSQTSFATHLVFKPRAHVRLAWTQPFFADDVGICRVPSSEEVGKWRVMKGTVVRVGVPRVLEWTKLFQCTKCRGQWELQSEREAYNAVSKPRKCMADQDGDQQCNGKVVEVDTVPGSRPEACKDYQEIKLQEPMEKVGLGTIPRSITVVVEDDLVDTVKPGDEIYLTGIVIRRFKPLKVNQRPDVQLSIVANHIRFVNVAKDEEYDEDDLRKDFDTFWLHWKGREMEGRDIIMKSVAPGIYGMYGIKLALLLALIGGVERNESGMKIRGSCHMLLVGDPGTGKSQFLRFAAQLHPRSVLTTGIGSTTAGLTCAATKDGGEWHLEAGALVLADRGLCCIDEFGSIRSQDKTAIHEAMEQQTVSVAKAGLVCKLNTRCTVLAATNPKGQWEENRELEVNVALASPLLSRFDLIYVVVDRGQESWDRQVSSFILGLESLSQSEVAHAYSPVAPSHGVPMNSDWPIATLRHYLNLASSIAPTLSLPAQKILQTYYAYQRRTDHRSAARTTIRLLESLIRLSQAHARLMWRAEVGVVDAVMAVACVEGGVGGIGLLVGMTNLRDVGGGTWDDSEAHYREIEMRVLQGLRLEHLSTTTTTTSLDQESNNEASQQDAGNDEEPLCSWPTTQHSSPPNSPGDSNLTGRGSTGTGKGPPTLLLDVPCDEDGESPMDERTEVGLLGFSAGDS